MADDFTRKRFQWLDQVAADPAVTAAGFVLAYRIAKFFNRETGDAWPAQPTLAAAMRMDTRSVRRLCDQLEAAGHLQVLASCGRGHSCRYRSIFHAEPDQNEPEREAESEPEAVTAALAPEPQDTAGFVIDETVTADTPKKKSAPRAKPKDLTADFEAFWLQYPRKVSKGAAASAYAKARKGATADEILTGAMRYAALRSDQDPTYTKHGASWLNQKCWLDEPEPARAGNFGEQPQSFQRQAPLSHVEIALAGLKRDE
jgi:hypothetical protein